MVAAEASADLHGSSFVRALRVLRPGVHVVGIGGTHSAAEGVELIERSDALAVMGFAEVIAHIPKHWSLLRALRGRLESGARWLGRLREGRIGWLHGFGGNGCARRCLVGGGRW